MGTMISAWIRRISTSWVTLSALVIFLLFTALVLPNQAAQARAETGGAGSPDTSLFYTAAALYEAAGAYGQAGRAAYIRARFTFDVIWPLVYMAFLSTSISWLFQRAFAPGSRWQLANLVPVGGVLFDYLENTATSIVMFRFPAPTPLVDLLAGPFTAVKWILVGGSFILLAIGVLVAAWRRLRPGRQPAGS